MENNKSKFLGDAMYTFFEKYSEGCNVFFETGSQYGDSIERGVLLGNDKVISVELNSDRYRHCNERFAKEIQEGKVHLFSGDSVRLFDEMCSLLDPSDKCFFWLDAHGEGGGAPVLEELEILKKYNRKNDVIAIDDMTIYYRESIIQIEQSLKELNPDYNIHLDDIHSRGMPAIMVATKNVLV